MSKLIRSDLPHGTLVTYSIGFVLSLVLTIGAYLAVTTHMFTGSALIACIMILAVLQLCVQLVFFLHLGQEDKPRWNLVVFLFMLLVLLIVVFGSLWIMNNLNYHMMSPHETDRSIMEDEGIAPKHHHEHH